MLTLSQGGTIYFSRRPEPNIGVALEDDIGRARSDVSVLAGPHPRDVPEAAGPLEAALLQEHGARGAVARVRPETDDHHSANHRVRQDGARVHEVVAGRPNRVAQSR